jgi:hypothetical protein
LTGEIARPDRLLARRGLGHLQNLAAEQLKQA